MFAGCARPEQLRLCVITGCENRPWTGSEMCGWHRKKMPDSLRKKLQAHNPRDHKLGRVKCEDCHNILHEYKEFLKCLVK